MSLPNNDDNTNKSCFQTNKTNTLNKDIMRFLGNNMVDVSLDKRLTHDFLSVNPVVIKFANTTKTKRRKQQKRRKQRKQRKHTKKTNIN